MTTFSLFGCFRRHFKGATGEAPKDIQDAFSKYATNGKLDANKLLLFLREVQGEPNATLEQAQNLLNRQLGHFGSRVRHGELNLDDFLKLLLDPALNPPLEENVHHDMKQPLSHYYIYTGHNSYLTGNQLSSDCSVVPIVNALKKGVRVIELDLWPNSNKTKIQVLHGKTLTAPVDFKECIIAIRDNAFSASMYPVIITLEDHLPKSLQSEASTIIKQVLGKVLYFPETEEPMKEFPCPETLKGRIMVSTKPPKEYLESQAEITPALQEKLEEEDTKEERVEELVKDKAEEGWGEEVPEYVAKPLDESFSEPDLVKQIASTDEAEDTRLAIDPSYARLITIRSGKPSGNSIKDSLAVEEVVKRVSLSEPQLEKVAKAHPDALILFSQRNIVRVYPFGLRFNSSNYNPLVSWTHGAQMVAFNMQGYGRPLWLVQGFFRANGGCGYVRKPRFLLETENGQGLFNPTDIRPVKTKLKVKVLTGLGWLERFGKHHFDRFSPPDFYTRVGIAGVPADTIMKKTKTVEDDWTPNWESQFEFPLTLPELALLRVEVHEFDMSDKDDFGGQTCLPIPELKTGYRCLQLFDKKGVAYQGVRLLVHLEFVPQL